MSSMLAGSTRDEREHRCRTAVESGGRAGRRPSAFHVSSGVVAEACGGGHPCKMIGWWGAAPFGASVQWQAGVAQRPSRMGENKGFLGAWSGWFEEGHGFISVLDKSKASAAVPSAYDPLRAGPGNRGA